MQHHKTIYVDVRKSFSFTESENIMVGITTHEDWFRNC